MNKPKLIFYTILLLSWFHYSTIIEPTIHKAVSISVMMVLLIDLLVGAVKYMTTDSNESDDGAIKIEKLRDMIIDADGKMNTSHIIIGDYSAKSEIDSGFKLINIDNANNFLIPFSDAYRQKRELMIIIETEGGEIMSTDIIFRSLLDYPYGVTVYVINFALSAGAFITLAAKNIHMSPWSVLGPTDPQIVCDSDIKEYEGSSKCYMEMLNNKHDRNISERMYMTSIDAKKYHEENINYITESLTKNGYPAETINRIIDELCSGKHSHGKPFNSRMLKELGLKINDHIPDYIYDINRKARRFIE
jgi:hypothetical protein